MHTKLFESAESVMKVDWLDESFPSVIPEDFHVFNKLDTDILQQVLADEGNSVEFLHQLGVLIIDEYLKVCDQSNSVSESYRSIPPVAHPFAFECSNGCRNIYTKEGRAERVTSSNVYVMQSILNPGSMDEELLQYLENDSSIPMRLMTITHQLHGFGIPSQLAEPVWEMMNF